MKTDAFIKVLIVFKRTIQSGFKRYSLMKNSDIIGIGFLKAGLPIVMRLHMLFEETSECYKCYKTEIWEKINNRTEFLADYNKNAIIV